MSEESGKKLVRGIALIIFFILFGVILGMALAR